jgi:hypothetical protein
MPPAKSKRPQPRRGDRSRSLTAVERRWLGKAWRTDRHGWLALHIAGEPRERGFQHGYLAAPELGDILQMVRFSAKWDTGEDFDFFVDAARRLYAGLLDAELRDEIEGIALGATAAGVPVSFAEVLAWNAYIELTWSWWPTVKGNLPGDWLHRHHHCSAFIATGKGVTRGGGIVLAHNTWDTFLNSNAYRLILDIAPARGCRMLMHSAPGLIHSGTDFFISGSGIIGAESTIAGFAGYDPKALPEFIRVRKAMQYANDIDTWICTMTTDNNGGYANIWLIGDVNSGEIARLELGLKYVDAQRTKRGFFWGCNLVEDPRIRNQECVGVNYSDITAAAARRVRMDELLTENSGRLDCELAKRIMADHHDLYYRRINPCTRSICGHFDNDPGVPRHGPFAPFEPYGANDAKVTDSAMARNMALLARYGRPCGEPFNANAFLKKHPQYAWQAKFLRSKSRHPWSRFVAGER